MISFYGNPIFYWIWIEYITFCRSLFMHLLIIMVWMFLFFYESVEKWIRYNHKYSSVLVKHGMIWIYQQNDLIHSWNHSKLNSWIEDNLFFDSLFDSQTISEGFGLVIHIFFGYLITKVYTNTIVMMTSKQEKPPSSSGLGHLSFKEAAGIRLPLGVGLL